MNILANLPFIPFVHNAEDVIFFFYVFARVSGLFLISPILASQMVNTTTRIMLAVFVSIFISMTLYGDYRGENPIFVLHELKGGAHLSVLHIILTMIKEFTVGYLIGYAFTIIFEALLVGGQVIGVLMGFSIMDIIDPVTQTTRPLISQFFVVIVTLLVLSVDMHHQFLREVMRSFAVLPIGTYSMPFEMVQDVSHGTSRIFHYALQFVALPYVLLLLITVALGFIAKVMPEMNIFILGFPLKILIGYYALILAVGQFPQVLQRAFTEAENFARAMVRHAAG